MFTGTLVSRSMGLDTVTGVEAVAIPPRRFPLASPASFLHPSSFWVSAYRRLRCRGCSDTSSSFPLGLSGVFPSSFFVLGLCLPPSEGRRDI
eukprot:g5563.t1